MNGDSSLTIVRPSVPWGAVVLVALWIWAIWSCAEHWRVNPNYSYGWAVPLLALGFGIRRYFMTASESADQLRSAVQFRAFAMAPNWRGLRSFRYCFFSAPRPGRRGSSNPLPAR